MRGWAAAAMLSPGMESLELPGGARMFTMRSLTRWGPSDGRNVPHDTEFYPWDFSVM